MRRDARLLSDQQAPERIGTRSAGGQQAVGSQYARDQQAPVRLARGQDAVGTRPAGGRHAVGRRPARGRQEASRRPARSARVALRLSVGERRGEESCAARVAARQPATRRQRRRSGETTRRRARRRQPARRASWQPRRPAVGPEATSSEASQAFGWAVASSARHLGVVARRGVHEHALAAPVDGVREPHGLRAADALKDRGGGDLSEQNAMSMRDGRQGRARASVGGVCLELRARTRSFPTTALSSVLPSDSSEFALLAAEPLSDGRFFGCARAQPSRVTPSSTALRLAGIAQGRQRRSLVVP